MTADVDRVTRLKGEVVANQAEIDLLAESFDESTGLSWLWAFLFGPIYYLVHGFWQRALIVLILNFIFFIGFIVSPFLVYPAWKKRAQERAEKMIIVDKLRGRV